MELTAEHTGNALFLGAVLSLEEAAHQLGTTAIEQLNGILVRLIVILHHEALGIVGHLSCIVGDRKAIEQLVSVFPPNPRASLRNMFQSFARNIRRYSLLTLATSLLDLFAKLVHLILLENGVKKDQIGSSRCLAGVLQDGDDTVALVINKIQCVLVVIQLDFHPLDTLALVLDLL